VREYIGTQRAQDSLKHSDADETDGDDIQRGHAAVHQHLVDDHLEKQRRQQGKYLQKQRRGEHFAEYPAVFVDGPQEPSGIETVPEVAEVGPAGREDKPAGPERGEVRRR
jgi:hypothetical protein